MQFLAGLWSRYKKIDPGISLGSNALGIYGWFTGGSLVSAGLLTYWHWFWDAFGLAGLPVAFLASWFALAIGFFLIGLGRYLWASRIGASGGSSVASPTDKIFPPTVTQKPPALRTGLYVGEIRFTTSELKTDRHMEISIRVFNGTGSTVDIGDISGKTTFSAPNSTDPNERGELPTPALRSDTSRISHPLSEWFLILSQRVPAAEADKIVSMVERKRPVHLDLTNLTINVASKDGQKDSLPLWGGVSYAPEFGYGRIIHAVAHISVGAKVSVG